MFTLGKRERTTFLDDRGMAVDGYRVWFVMDDGTVDYVEVEKSQYNVDVVHDEIQKAIARHGALSGN